MRRLVVHCGLLVLVLGGCGGRAALPPSCTQMTTNDVMRALRTAPGRVALSDGTALSTCVGRAIDSGDLQQLGYVLTDAAERLNRQMPASDVAGMRLGYLIGATQRGAAMTPGVQTQLADRIGEIPGFAGGPPNRRVALARGRVAGRRRG